MYRDSHQALNRLVCCQLQEDDVFAPRNRLGGPSAAGSSSLLLILHIQSSQWQSASPGVAQQAVIPIMKKNLLRSSLLWRGFLRILFIILHDGSSSFPGAFFHVLSRSLLIPPSSCSQDVECGTRMWE